MYTENEELYEELKPRSYLADIFPPTKADIEEEFHLLTQYNADNYIDHNED